MKNQKKKINISRRFSVLKKIRMIIPAFSRKAISLILAIALSGLWPLYPASAMFSDLETSEGNIFTAGSIDFSISGTGFGSPIVPDDERTSELDVSNNGTLGFQYTLEIDGADETLCTALNLTIKLDGNPVYSGLLTEFTQSTQTFTDPESWQFIASLASDNYTFQGLSCDFDFVLTGWQTDLSGPESGFSDTESVSRSITSGSWEETSSTPATGIVLNEFLPNPTGDDAAIGIAGEWVELYNNNDEMVDVAGWYLYDNNPDGMEITTENTNGSTTVYPFEYFIVYRNGYNASKFSLNNTGDTISLYTGPKDSSGILVDTYTYSASEYCALEPTPETGNYDLPSSEGSCSGIPENKSYARIPDGTGPWYDPIPTPGQPNTLENPPAIDLTQESNPDRNSDEVPIPETPTETENIDDPVIEPLSETPPDEKSEKQLDHPSSDSSEEDSFQKENDEIIEDASDVFVDTQNSEQETTTDNDEIKQTPQDLDLQQLPEAQIPEATETPENTSSEKAEEEKPN